MKKSSGILMHISSLSSPGGIGKLGQEAYDFADFLQASGMQIWQVLPIGPTGYGESPYQSSSVFAGNPLLISCERLREEGLLNFEDNEACRPDNPETVPFDAVRESKTRLLRKCFAQSRESLQSQVDLFVKENDWVWDFALFTAVKAHFGGTMWSQWPDADIRLRKAAAVRAYAEKLKEEIAYHIFCQFLFDSVYVRAGLVDFVDRHDDLDSGCPGVIDCLNGLRHDAVVRSNNQDGNIRRIGAAHTHGRESFMTGRVEEGDLLPVACDH